MLTWVHKSRYRSQIVIVTFALVTILIILMMVQSERRLNESQPVDDHMLEAAILRDQLTRNETWGTSSPIFASFSPEAIALVRQSMPNRRIEHYDQSAKQSGAMDRHIVCSFDYVERDIDGTGAARAHISTHVVSARYILGETVIARKVNGSWRVVLIEWKSVADLIEE